MKTSLLSSIELAVEVFTLRENLDKNDLALRGGPPREEGLGRVGPLHPQLHSFTELAHFQFHHVL